MENRDKEIRKLMAEKGFDSFDDLSERLNQFPKTDSYEDVVDKLAELKMQLINPQPLFTLTAEEVTIVEHFLTYDKMLLETYESSQENDIMIGDLNHILNKIKDYRNGKEV